MAARSFRLQIIALTVLAATVPIIMLGLPVATRFSSLARDSSARELSLVAEKVAESLANRLQLIVLHASNLRSDSDVHRSVKSILFLDRADLLLGEFLNSHDLVAEVHLLNQDDKQLTAAPLTTMMRPLPNEMRGLMRDAAGNIAERTSLKGYFIMTRFPDGTFKADMASPPNPRKDFSRGDSGLALLYVAPIVGLMNQRSGTLIAVMPIERILAVMQGGLTGPTRLDLLQGDASLLGAVKVPTTEEIMNASASLQPDFSDPPLAQWLVQIAEPYNFRFASVQKTFFLVVALLLVTLMVLAGVGFLAARWLIQPLQTLTSYVGQFTKGNYQAVKPQARFFEFQKVVDTLDDMGKKTLAHIEAEKARLGLELNALRNQMGPHFLFNSLNSIATMISIDPARAAEMLEKLSSLYRLILDSSKSVLWPLEHEIEMVGHYLALEQMRFGKRLRYTIDVGPEVKLLRFPPLLLQTLVENAVKHGVARSREGGAILILVEPNTVLGYRLAVTNSGSPLNAVQRISDSGGTGLANTRKRLDLLYGPEHGLAIKSLGSGETMVEFFFSASPKTFD